MFGSPTKLLFEYILGIKQERDSAGFERIVIEPALNSGLSYVSGHLTAQNGKIQVAYRRDGEKITLDISLPQGVEATVRLGEKEFGLTSGGRGNFSCRCE
jgi:alpha-L-rhamnosidase